MSALPYTKATNKYIDNLAPHGSQKTTSLTIHNRKTFIYQTPTDASLPRTSQLSHHLVHVFSGHNSSRNEPSPSGYNRSADDTCPATVLDIESCPGSCSAQRLLRPGWGGRERTDGRLAGGWHCGLSRHLGWDHAAVGNHHVLQSKHHSDAMHNGSAMSKR